MEADFHPLKLCKLVDDKLKEFEAATDHPLVQYCNSLREMTLVRLLKQVCTYTYRDNKLGINDCFMMIY